MTQIEFKEAKIIQFTEKINLTVDDECPFLSFNFKNTWKS